MKKRYELQCQSVHTWRWLRSAYDTSPSCKTLNGKIEKVGNNEYYRVVQKLGRKVIKVVYPKGSK